MTNEQRLSDDQLDAAIQIELATGTPTCLNALRELRAVRQMKCETCQQNLDCTIQEAAARASRDKQFRNRIISFGCIAWAAKDGAQ